MNHAEKVPPPPILEIVERSGFPPEVFVDHLAVRFIQHDRVMLKAFERWAGAARALAMHDRVWNNPTQPLGEIFRSVGPSVEDRLIAYARAFYLHDYYSMRVLREEVGDVVAIEAHHSLMVDQVVDTAVVPGYEPDQGGELGWEDLFEQYRAHAARQGLLYDLVEISEDKLTIDSTHCAYFDTISYEVGREAAEEHNHLIAIDSTDRTIEGFFAGAGRTDEFRGVMTKHRCHGDEVCRIEFTRRDPQEPSMPPDRLDRVGTRCFFCRDSIPPPGGPQARGRT